MPQRAVVFIIDVIKNIFYFSKAKPQRLTQEQDNMHHYNAAPDLSTKQTIVLAAISIAGLFGMTAGVAYSIKSNTKAYDEVTIQCKGEAPQTFRNAKVQFEMVRTKGLEISVMDRDRCAIVPKGPAR